MQRLVTMRFWSLGIVLASLLMASCITKPSSTSTSNSASNPKPAAANLSRWVLLRTDLGLGDGYMVRLADAELTRRAKANTIRYEPVGELPKPLENEAGADDVGLPVPHSKEPGEMTLAEAAQLLSTVPACDVLVISSGYLAADGVKALTDGKVQAKALLLLDEQGIANDQPASSVPVIRVRYDIKPLALLAGIAAADSAVNSHFGVLYAADDPQGEVFARAAKAGAKYHTNGAWTEVQPVPVGPLGYLTGDQFLSSLAELRKQGGPNWRPDHFIVALGRSTPTVINALSKKPDNAYLVAGYGDYRAVRPARVVGCVLKHPDRALAALFAKLAEHKNSDVAAGMVAVAPEGLFTVGLDDDAVGFTDFSLYNQYNTDGPDIEETVHRNLGLIRTGEIGIEY